MGIIAIEGMQFYAHHGYYKEEQVIGGQYTVDLYLRADLEEAAEQDDLKKTINYENLYRLVLKIMEERSKLIEHVAKRILDTVAGEYENLHYVKVRVSKLHPPLKGTVERVYVTLEKELDNS